MADRINVSDPVFMVSSSSPFRQPFLDQPQNSLRPSSWAIASMCVRISEGIRKPTIGVMPVDGRRTRSLLLGKIDMTAIPASNSTPARLYTRCIQNDVRPSLDGCCHCDTAPSLKQTAVDLPFLRAKLRQSLSGVNSAGLSSREGWNSWQGGHKALMPTRAWISGHESVCLTIVLLGNHRRLLCRHPHIR